MTLTQMRYFDAACRMMNYTKAAEALHVTQPAISAAVKEMEAACGTALLQRKGSSFTLTEEGKILLEEVRKVLCQCEKLDAVAESLNRRRTLVRVGFSTFSGNLVFSRVLRRMQEKHPEVEIEAMEAPTGEQFSLLNQNQLDVIITNKEQGSPEEETNFSKTYGRYTLASTPMVFCVSRQNPLAGRKYLTLQEIAEVPIIMLQENFNQARLLQAAFDSRGLHPKIIHRTHQMYTLVRFIEDNAAGGFIPQETVQHHPDIVGIPFENCPNTGLVEAYWVRERHQFAATKTFLEELREMFPKEQQKPD